MSREDWSIIVDDHDMKKMAEDEKVQWQRHSIYKLPACVTKINPNAYTPQVVSFGPYHCKDQNLKPMEKNKDRALSYFLKRSRVSHEQCLGSLSEIVSDLMGAYDSLDAEFQQNPNAFLKLMVRDGCFMLEIFRAWKEKLLDYAPNDPIFSKHGKIYVMPHIRRDMLMLENQLPMMVLHKLYRLQKVAKEDMANKIPAPEAEGNELVFQFLFPTKRKTTTAAPSDSLHILDMYRKGMLGPNPAGIDNTKKNDENIPEGSGDNNITPSSTPAESVDDKENEKGDDPKSNFIQKIQNFLCQKGQNEASEDIMRSAVELDEAGIKIKWNKSTTITGITFKNGELSLPMITVDDLTEPLYLNLIAYERFHVGAGNEVTDYVFFMDNIIDDALDIKLLHYEDIIQNGIGSDKAAAKLFNSLSKDITLDNNSPLGVVYKRVNAYCKRKIHKYRAALYHKYFTSPWAAISVLAAIFLFALTITQTVYTILQYHQ